MSERWKPEINEQFWCLDTCMQPVPTTNNGWSIDQTRIAIGNCFKTEAEAEAAAEKVKALLLSLHTTQDTTQDEQLPAWCKVGEWVWYIGNDVGYVPGYMKILLVYPDNKKINTDNFIGAPIDQFKPARLRPYNANEMKALVGKVIKETKSGDISFVTGFCNRTELIYSGTNSFSAESLLSDFVFTDNAPCGVLEHLENGKWVE